ncbi:DNA polymerase III subunit delta' [Gemella sp. GH3]|uniref:DNA polymerase III subunit delta' n=1 Tax=unclassified Gemella TaxID=2624949 RepID=UPI0015D0A5C0|nr:MULTISPECIES: DNA polymerase III subunit delta' [unclassified Gemella]MBF0714455.1 DNA polymerase III subunit delta' [Gemella sp. GH3.1]NYS51407.1 DNA polymerase III subunit delta' [Gemella sp. GH3]
MNEVTNKYLTNVLKHNKLSHAYMFVGTNNDEIDEYVLSFVKAICCENNDNKSFYSCENCKTCKQINKNNYIDFLIFGEKESIKKQDIINLKQELSVKAVVNKKIYWLKNIDNVTKQAANSLLKILEEPEDNIIAILTTTNVMAIMDTLISRCQVINVTGSVNDDLDESISEMKVFIREFLRKYKTNKNLAAIDLLEKLKNKEDIEKFFKLMLFYLDRLRVNDNNIIKDMLIIYSEALSAKKSLEMNVAPVLILENFIFKLILRDCNLDFLEV